MLVNKAGSNVKQRQKRGTRVKIIALGGLNEIGKNMYLFECSNDLFIIDCGLCFPDSDMLGVDIVIQTTLILSRTGINSVE